MPTPNTDLFAAAYQQALASRTTTGIGTLSEKILHATLKHYYAPGADTHEIKIGRYIADIVGEDGIIEIQTQAFDRLRKKLEAFLAVARVTVVLPIARQKWICLADPDTGEVVSRRKSPQRGTIYHAMPELYKIKYLLGYPGLTLRFPLMDMEEYRLLSDRPGRYRRTKARRHQRVPLELVEEIALGCDDDYNQFLPELPELFDSGELAKAAHIPLRLAQVTLNILLDRGVIAREGKRGRRFLYRKALALPPEMAEKA